MYFSLAWRELSITTIEGKSCRMRVEEWAFSFSLTEILKKQTTFLYLKRSPGVTNISWYSNLVVWSIIITHLNHSDIPDLGKYRTFGGFRSVSLFNMLRHLTSTEGTSSFENYRYICLPLTKMKKIVDFSSMSPFLICLGIQRPTRSIYGNYRKSNELVGFSFSKLFQFCNRRHNKAGLCALCRQAMKWIGL